MFADAALQTLASTTKPAAGAAIGQVILATAGGLAMSFGVLALVVGHRSGRLKIVGRATALAEREAGVAARAARPGAPLGTALSPPGCRLYPAIPFDSATPPEPVAPAHPPHHPLPLAPF